MFIHPALNTVLSPQRPNVTLMHTASSVSALTTYTFTGASLSNFGGTNSFVDGYTTDPNVRIASKKFLAVLVHAEDSATVFSISNVTIGGVSGVEAVDRGGATQAINSGIYIFSTDSLAGITSSDVVVTMSEAVTGCAIGVVEVENVSTYGTVTSGSGLSSGIISADLVAPSLAVTDRNMLILAASTCLVGTETAQFYFAEQISTTSSFFAPQLLYDLSTANYAYAASWAYSSQYIASNTNRINCSWSDVSQADMAAALFY
jgi:hypothetical protein